jgi:disulfide bond formation protein DsbB
MTARGLTLTVFPGHIGLVRALLRFWPWAALGSSLLMLGVAHAFETFGRLAPCELCLKEREVYWVAATLALAGGALTLSASPAVRGVRLAWADLALALVFLGGTVLAAYHAGVEWKFWPGPASCTGGHVQVSAADLARLLHGGPIAVPQCDRPAWVFLGISMAGWNALISLKLTVLSALAAWSAPRKVSAR